MASDTEATAAKGEEDDYSGNEEEVLRAKNQCGINVRFQGSEDDSNLVIASLSITFGKLLNRFAKARGIDPAGFKLLAEGEPLIPESTPKMMEWKAGRHYQLDCMATQVGGGQPS